jgi:uncharacterized protein
MEIVVPEIALPDAGLSDPVRRSIRGALERMYGNQIDRVILFGSRARGDAHADSDYDVALFLKTLPDFWKEMHRLADLGFDLLDEMDVLLDVKPFPAEAYHERTPLMYEVRRDGIDL